MARPDHAAALGSFVLSAKEMKELIQEEGEKAHDIRQAAYDATIQMMGERVTPAQARELIAVLSSEEFQAMLAERPGEMAGVIRDLMARGTDGR